MTQPDAPKNNKNEQVINLYQSNKRIHPKLAKGRFANWRILAVLATQVFFFLLPWLNFSGRQAVLFDIPDRHFYIFNIILLPNDLIYLTGLLLVSAFGLFWWTTIAGRLWCGYACPQTVYTEIMLWIDHFFEGDRNKRLKLEKSKWNLHKIRVKGIKYLVIALFCAWTGFTFVGWFSPIRELFADLTHFNLSATQLFTMSFYGFMTFLFAHIMREQVCKYMCPYARFQSAMFDEDTLIISYDEVRGEPRGVHKKDKDNSHLGDCINCTLCVQVCPVGIDIREGLQYECIGCAACIDACDEVMDKIEKPRGLIRYTTEAALENKYPESKIINRMARPRVLGYGAILLIVIITLMASLFMRDTLRVDIVKDRGVMVRQNNKGWLENAYTLRFENSNAENLLVSAKVEGFDNILLTGIPDNLEITAGDNLSIPVQVSTIPEYADRGSHPIKFIFTYRTRNGDEVKILQEKAIFIGE